GLAYIDTIDQMYTVKRSPVDVVLPTGTAVLKADDPLVADMISLSAGSVTLFAHSGDHPLIATHRGEGKRAVFVRDGQIILAEGEQETPLLPLAQVPLTLGGRVPFQVENVLAAVGAGWALGIPESTIRSVLETFHADMQDCPGRFNLFEHRGATIV